MSFQICIGDLTVITNVLLWECVPSLSSFLTLTDMIDVQNRFDTCKEISLNRGFKPMAS